MLAKIRVSLRTLLTLFALYWPQRPWFVDLLQLSVAPPVPLSARTDLLFQPRSRRLFTGLHRLALHAWGLSSAFPGQLVSPQWWLRRLCWHAVLHHAPPTSSSGRFTGYGAALRATPSRGHPSPRYRTPSGDFDRFGALVSPPSRALGRCSQWCSSSISLPSSHVVLRDLLRSFRVSAPSYPMRSPSWDLLKVLSFLNSGSFEPLRAAPLRALSKKVLFLLALATAKRVGELQAISHIVSFVGGVACLSYVPEFVAKSESLSRSIPCSFLVKSLSDFVAGLDVDLFLCPVSALRVSFDRTLSLAPSRLRLFVSPKLPHARHV